MSEVAVGNILTHRQIPTMALTPASSSSNYGDQRRHQKLSVGREPAILYDQRHREYDPPRAENYLGGATGQVDPIDAGYRDGD